MLKRVSCFVCSASQVSTKFKFIVRLLVGRNCRTNFRSVYFQLGRRRAVSVITYKMADQGDIGTNSNDLNSVAVPDPKNMQELTHYVSRNVQNQIYIQSNSTKSKPSLQSMHKPSPRFPKINDNHRQLLIEIIPKILTKLTLLCRLCQSLQLLQIDRWLYYYVVYYNNNFYTEIFIFTIMILFNMCFIIYLKYLHNQCRVNPEFGHHYCSCYLQTAMLDSVITAFLFNFFI